MTPDNMTPEKKERAKRFVELLREAIIEQDKKFSIERQNKKKENGEE